MTTAIPSGESHHLASARHWLEVLRSGTPNYRECIHWMYQSLSYAGSDLAAIGTHEGEVAAFPWTNTAAIKGLCRRAISSGSLSDYHLRAVEALRSWSNDERDLLHDELRVAA